jgi:hypothetical protein
MILEQIYTSELLRNYAKKVTQNDSLWEDIITEMYLYLKEIDQSYVQQLHERGQLTAYCCKIIFNSWNSKTSPFYRKYISKDLDIIDNYNYILLPDDAPDYQTILKRIEHKSDEYPYAIVLFNRYSELKSYTKLYKEIKEKTGSRIPYTTLIHIIENVRNEIKKLI